MKSFPKMTVARLAACAAIATAVACSADPAAPINPQAVPALSGASGHAIMPTTAISFLSRNVYIGIDADAVIVALANGDPSDDVPALIAAIETLQKTAYPSRAKALAAEFKRTRPHFVGLQEISKLNIQIPPLGVSINLDFLAILQAELNALGLNYVVAASVQNSDVSLAPIPGSVIEVLDYDVILVDARRVSFDASSVISQRFAVNIGPVAPGVNLWRGFVAITAEVRGVLITVANTHLESGDAFPIPQIRGAQTVELLSVMEGDGPAIIMGDLNDIPGSAMHQAVTGAGFVDSWSAHNPGRDGYTCCHVADLSNSSATLLDRRLDYVFVRGGAELRNGLMGRSSLVGARPSERVDGPAHAIWPSDHAGVHSEVRFSRVPVRGLSGK